MKITGLLFVFLFLTLLIAGQEKKAWPPEEEIVGNTFYDVQTTRSMQNRIYYFEDGTQGIVYNFVPDLQPWMDFGIGYNYYNGTIWNPYPNQSITSGTARNPSYSNLGPNGEIVASESATGLYINYRFNKGVGEWEEVILPCPPGFDKICSPQVVTTGSDNEIIHLIALLKDSSISFTDPFQDNKCRVIYFRSSNGGVTWDYYDFDFNNDYFGFSELSVVCAKPKGNTLAFLVGDYYTDLILMKSFDGGDNWQKTIVWEHPIPFFEQNVTLITDGFWACSGSQSLALDSEFRAHIAFSVSCIFSDTIYWTGNYDWWSDGIVYWNNDRPAFSNNPNALNPGNHPESELIIDYSLVGWSPDINGNGVLDFMWQTPYNSIYPTLGISTQPSLAISENDYVFIVYSSVTETYVLENTNFRHLWARLGLPGGVSWGFLYDLTNDLIHIFDECVYPCVASQVDDYFHLMYQYDSEPGLCIEGGVNWPCENLISSMTVEPEYPCVYLTPSFYAQSTTIEEGDSILFINTSTGNPDPNYFEWTFEGGTPSSSNLEDPVVQYNAQGTFDVTLFVSNGEMNQTLTIEDYITVLPGTGTRDFESVRIDIMPNPGSGKFLVTIHPDYHTQVNVYDLLGEEISEIETNPGDDGVVIDLTGQNEGIYFVKIKTAGSRIIRKIMLNR